ncbi:MAG: AI-2E family transporter [Leptolyngbya sp. IPPAS B-1204]|nr:AI-2E family transporter [Elainella sp. C42_A2020_010]
MKLGRWIGLLVLLVALYLVWRIRQVLLLIFTAMILTIPLNRLVKRWQQLGMRRGIANLLAFLTLLTFLLLFGGLIVPPLVEQGQRLIQLVGLALERLLVWLLQLQSQLPEAWRPVSAISLTQQAQLLLGWIVDHFFALFSDLLTLLLHGLLVLVLTVMLLANPAAYRRGAIRLVPAFYRERVDTVLAECERKLAIWMQITLWEMLAVGLATAVVLGLLRVPLVLTNAAIAGFLEIIPHLGVFLSLIPPVAAAWLSSPEKAIAVVVLYLVIQVGKYQLLHPFLHRQFLSDNVTSHSRHRSFSPAPLTATREESLGQKTIDRPAQRPGALLPALLLLAQLSLAFFCGLTGLLLAVPLVIVTQVWVRAVLTDHSKGRQMDRDLEAKECTTKEDEFNSLASSKSKQI